MEQPAGEPGILGIIGSIAGTVLTFMAQLVVSEEFKVLTAWLGLLSIILSILNSLGLLEQFKSKFKRRKK